MSKKLHIALVMRLFSSQGGLELYALKLVEGLLGRDRQCLVWLYWWGDLGEEGAGGL